MKSAFRKLFLEILFVNFLKQLNEKIKQKTKMDARKCING